MLSDCSGRKWNIRRADVRMESWPERQEETGRDRKR